MSALFQMLSGPRKEAGVDALKVGTIGGANDLPDKCSAAIDGPDVFDPSRKAAFEALRRWQDRRTNRPQAGTTTQAAGCRARLLAKLKITSEAEIAEAATGLAPLAT
jgi:hypothetical protein